jgi:hypothetical protein
LKQQVHLAVRRVQGKVEQKPDYIRASQIEPLITHRIGTVFDALDEARWQSERKLS